MSPCVRVLCGDCEIVKLIRLRFIQDSSICAGLSGSGAGKKITSVLGAPQAACDWNLDKSANSDDHENIHPSRSGKLAMRCFGHFFFDLSAVAANPFPSDPCGNTLNEKWLRQNAAAENRRLRSNADRPPFSEYLLCPPSPF